MKNLCYALSLIVAACSPGFSQSAYPVRFSHGTEYFPENYDEARQNHKAEAVELINGNYARYIQLNKILNARERAGFEATGLQIIGYIQFSTYLVLLPENYDFQKLEVFSPRSIVRVKPEWKMARSLRELPYGDWAVHGDYVDLNIQLYPAMSIPEGAERCISLGLNVLKEGSQNGFLQLRVHKDHVGEVAALPFVQYLEVIPPPGQQEDTRGRAFHRSNLVAGDSPIGKKYDGTGVGMLVRDDGILGPHIDLQGRLHNKTQIDLPLPAGMHGDGVVGIAGGAGNLDPTKKGMATGADLYALEYINDFQDATLSLHLEEGIALTNSSYSDGCNEGYTLATQTVDQQIYEHPALMHVFSAGNSNNQDCGYGAGNQWGNVTGGHKMAKNGIVTANMNAEAVLEPSSSRGPAYDGRLKPDITAFGGQESLLPNNGYSGFGGTSGASPGIAGCMAQLIHAFKEIESVDDAPSALIKAAILNTANDMGNVGPDFKHGWGYINTWRALRLLEQRNWIEGDADQGWDITHSIQIPNGVKEAKFMLYWAEPPSLQNNAKALINDLDLTVVNAGGALNLPWKLNATPNAIFLNAPAGKGRDSLNNIEQVLINNPTAGTHTIHINGTEVPMGPQHYYLVWEFVTDEIKITYPAGGEGLVPGEVERINWDAYGNSGTFNLQYSVDGGLSYTTIANVAGDMRFYDWTIPNKISGKVYLLAIRGTERDTTDAPCTIAPVPQNLQVTKVCPDSVTLAWNEVNDTLSYEGYLLGAKYMEIRGMTDVNAVSMPIQSGGDEQWLSVRCSHADGLAGRRALAIYWPGGLHNCPQPQDLVLDRVVYPEGDRIQFCEPTDLAITINVYNNGLSPSTGATAYYQIDNNPPVSEALPDIPAGASLDYSFQTQQTIGLNGTISVKTWIDYPLDGINFNDTLDRIYKVVSVGATQFFTENFESSLDYPNGWFEVNPDASLGWRTTEFFFFPVVGPNDTVGNSILVDFYDYGPGQEGQEDYLYMIPADLTGLNNPALSFKLAHAPYNVLTRDGLRVEVFPNCDLNAPPQIIWEKSDPELATAPAQTDYYYTTSAGDWRREAIDLGNFAGQKILIRFTAVNGFGNILYLDDIGIVSVEPPPVAEFFVPDSVCRLTPVNFQATSTPNGMYTWTFGPGASPATATGIGPHSVSYTTTGNKIVRLFVSNGFGLDTGQQVVTVLNPATANFTTTQNLLTVSFNNTSLNSTSYLWDFGDGNMSTLANPVHTYAAPGAYVVKLSATNLCRTHEKTLTVGITGVNEIEERIGIQVWPNPTAGDFAVKLDSQISGKVQLNLFDAAGRKVKMQEIALKQGVTWVEFNNLNLPAGIYKLDVQADGKQSTFTIAVQ